MLGTVNLSIADDCERSCHEQAAQIAVTLFADTAEPVLAPARMLVRSKPDPSREVAPRSERLRISDARGQSGCQQRTDPRNIIKALARFCRPRSVRDETAKDVARYGNCVRLAVLRLRPVDEVSAAHTR